MFYPRRGKEDVCILRLVGRFAIGSSIEYSHTRDELNKTGCRKVIVDCRRIPYLDAAGLGFFVEFYKDLKNTGGDLVLANVNRRIREVLELTRLAELILVYEDEQAALGALKPPESWKRTAVAV